MLATLLILGALLQGCDDAAAPAAASLIAGTQPTQNEPAASLDRTIRVLLLSQQSIAALNVHSPFNVVDPRSGQVLLADLPPASIVGMFTPDGIEIPTLDLYSGSPVLEIVPTEQEPTEVRLADEWREFPGVIRLLRRDDGGAVINVVDIEAYLVGVVASELPAGFHPEAFRAQAVAARTYAWYARQTTGLKRDWDVWATERSQVYGSLERQRLVPRAAEAVRDTRGVVCTWSSPAGEKIFCTYFSSRCGGTTSAATRPSGAPEVRPLAGGVACEFCRRPDAYRWSTEPRISKRLIRDRLAGRFPRFQGIGPIDRVEVVESGPEGRAVRISVTDLLGRTAEIDGENFRLTVDPTGRLIQSTLFDLVDEADSIVLTDGRGLGHGTGMCQYGADALGRAGWRAPAILAHYYPGSNLTRAY